MVSWQTASISELKANLSRYVREVQRGGEVQVLHRGTPVARLVPPAPGHDDARQRLIAAGRSCARARGDAQRSFSTEASAEDSRSPASLEAVHRGTARRRRSDLLGLVGPGPRWWLRNGSPPDGCGGFWLNEDPDHITHLDMDARTEVIGAIERRVRQGLILSRQSDRRSALDSARRSRGRTGTRSPTILAVRARGERAPRPSPAARRRCRDSSEPPCRPGSITGARLPFVSSGPKDLALAAEQRGASRSRRRGLSPEPGPPRPSIARGAGCGAKGGGFDVFDSPIRADGQEERRDAPPLGEVEGPPPVPGHRGRWPRRRPRGMTRRAP